MEGYEGLYPAAFRCRKNTEKNGGFALGNIMKIGVICNGGSIFSTLFL